MTVDGSSLPSLLWLESDLLPDSLRELHQNALVAYEKGFDLFQLSIDLHELVFMPYANAPRKQPDSESVQPSPFRVRRSRTSPLS
jgi:hypothetical protein